jgi:hypothetical protein
MFEVILGLTILTLIPATYLYFKVVKPFIVLKKKDPELYNYVLGYPSKYDKNESVNIEEGEVMLIVEEGK